MTFFGLKRGGAGPSLLIILLVTLTTLGLAGAAAGASYESLYSCFPDLPGWQGQAPTGVNADMAGGKMVTAQKKYTKGDQQITAIIIKGQHAMAAVPAEKTEPMDVDMPEERMKFGKIDGFNVHQVYDKKGRSGSINVALETTAGSGGGMVFIFHFQGLDGDEALKLAKSFDWAKMKQKAKGI
ncbi:MAG: hypothetical protein HQK60_15950 [Deltaproteobacteria bacterium]|nr:hypothetical protein [Deltaproteobacteria bacterium]